MAHFAILDSEGRVAQVVVIEDKHLKDANQVEQESLGIEYCSGLFGEGTYVQCSYNDNIRGHYPAVGELYDTTNDIFVEHASNVPPSWSLDTNTGRYVSPIGFPEVDTSRPSPVWDESTLSWLYEIE